MFQYKTNGDVSPQGKRRVYFTCHHEDHERFFEKIKDEILKYSDSAIWYNNNDNDYEDINSDLGQMNLFVIPITTRLLTKPCRAMQLDVPFALENHIPILPLMQEGGLDELFTRYFGDLQYLDPNTHDITALSYEEKLKKYLNSVIIGDELAEKVRAAFDAYIFLSYRKKDRKYANELMRLIHKNEFCRDIAIWYDEFLVPGEDFNNAITAALKKSELFTLVVTPNLIDEDNYVKKYEYPAATKQHKKVLPVELVKTDHKELSKQYPEIPNCVDVQDEIALSKSFESALLNIAKKENDSDPEHNFFIGLAYLDGIDVEKNHERALILITSAAETNEVPEAIEKLVAMYKEGYGVKRDYRKAVEWQKKLVEYWERDKTKSIHSFNMMFEKIIELGDFCLLINNISDAEKSFVKALSLVQKITNTLPQLPEIEDNRSVMNIINNYFADKDHNNKYHLINTHFFWNKLWICFDKLGYLFCEKNDFDKSIDYYKKSIKLKRQLTGHNVPSETFDYLAFTYDKIGLLYESQMEFSKAEKYYLRSYDWRKNYKADFGLILNDDDNGWHELLSSYIDLGRINIKVDNLDLAESYFLDALSISEQRKFQNSSLENYYILSIIYEGLGQVYKEKGNFNNSEAYYLKAIEIKEQQSDSISNSLNLANIYDKIGNLYREWAYWDNSEEFFDKSLMCRQTLVENGVGEENIIWSYNNLGNLYLEMGQYDKAEELLQKSLVLTEQFIKKTESISNKTLLSDIYNNISNVFTQRCSNLCLEIIGGKNFKLSYFCKFWNYSNKAMKFLHKSLSINRELYKKTKNLEFNYFILQNLNSIGGIYVGKFKLNKANKYFQESLKICNFLSNKINRNLQNEYLTIYTQLGGLYKLKNDSEKSKEYYQFAINLVEKLIDETGFTSINQVLLYAKTYYSVAICLEPCDFILLKKSLDLFSVVDTQYPGFSQYSKIIDDIKTRLQEK